MTVSSLENRAGPYLCNDKRTAFPFSFKVYTPERLEVIQTDPSGREMVLALNQHYTVSLSATGGTVYMVAAPQRRHTITLRRNIPALQETDLQNQGAYFPEDIERSLDLWVMHAQQQDEAIERSIKLPFSSPGQTTILASATERAHKALIWDGKGNITVSKTPYEDHAGNAEAHADAAKAAKEAAEETVDALPRQMMSPDNPWLAFGSWLGVPRVIDCGRRTGDGGVSLRLGRRLDGKPVITCGRRLDTSTQRRIDLGSLIDETTYVLDLGERP